MTKDPSPHPLQALAEKARTLHDKIAQSHPSLTRGQVWCRACGATLKVDSAVCLRHGWPKCCGFTMTIDDPALDHGSRGT